MSEQTKPARRRPVRVHFRTGIEAALRADPEALAACKPRTQLGVVVRALVQEAGRGKTIAIKQMLSLIDWEEPETDEETDAECIAEGEPQWDWNESADWDVTPRAAENKGEPAPAAGGATRRLLPTEEEDNYFKNELRRRFARLNEADALEAVRRRKLNGAANNGGSRSFEERDEDSTGPTRN